MPNRTSTLNLQTLPAIYYSLYWFSVFTFAFAMLFTLPAFDDQIAVPMFSLLIRISAGLMAIMEGMELVVEPVPKWSVIIFIFNVAGTVLYLYSSFVYEQFSKGELYLIGAFFVSLSYQFKILAIVIQDGRRINTILSQQKYRIIRLSCMIAGTLLFLGGSVMNQLAKERTWKSAGVRLIGGVTAAVSALMLFKKNKHVGYAKFDRQMEIPTII